MAYTHMSGPIVSYGYSLSGNTSDPTVFAGPSLFYQGTALLDPRKGYNPGISVNPLTGPATVNAFVNSGDIVLADVAPATKAANNIAASQSPGAAGNLTLVSSSGAGVTAGVSITDIFGNTQSNLLALDGAYAPTLVGQTNFYNPATALQRTVTITSAGNDSGITFLVSGYDWYGQAVSQLVTGANTAAATTTKTFKYVASVFASAASASTVTVGTGDVFGINLRSTRFEYLSIFWNSALITATTGYVAAVTTSPATTTTGDVRGSYAVQSASDGTKKLVIFYNPQVADMLNATRTNYVSLYGVSQV